MSSHAVLSSLYGLSRWYAAKRQPPAEILCEMRPVNDRESTSRPREFRPWAGCPRQSIGDHRIVRQGGSSGPGDDRVPSASGTARDACSMLCRSRLLGMEHERKLAVPSHPVRPQPPPDLRAKREQTRRSSHAPRAATRRYTAGSPIASPSAPAELVTGAAIASCLALTKLRSSSCVGSDRWRSGLNRRSRKRTFDAGQVGRGCRVGRQAEPERHRNGQEAGGLDPEKAPGDLVAQLVILGAADPVNEEIAEQEAAEERRRQRAGAQADRRGRRARGAARRRNTPRAPEPAAARARPRPRRRCAGPSLASAAGPGGPGAAAVRPARSRTAPRATRPACARAATGWFLLRIPWAARYSSSASLWTCRYRGSWASRCETNQ